MPKRDRPKTPEDRGQVDAGFGAKDETWPFQLLPGGVLSVYPSAEWHVRHRTLLEQAELIANCASEDEARRAKARTLAKAITKMLTLGNPPVNKLLKVQQERPAMNLMKGTVPQFAVILGDDEMNPYVSLVDRIGQTIQQSAVALGLASQEKPVYVPVNVVIERQKRAREASAGNSAIKRKPAAGDALQVGEGAAGYAGTRRPQGPPCRKGQDMPPNDPSPEERARRTALKVDSLYHGNPARWKEQWAAAVAEEKAWHEQWQDAEKAERAALDAVWREVRDVEASRGKPHLTDPDYITGEGWCWRRVEIRDPEDWRRVQSVEAWMPPEAFWMPDARSPRDKGWPGPNPTLPAKYLALAVVHDWATDSTILDAETAASKAVGNIVLLDFNDGQRHTGGTHVDSLRRMEAGELRFTHRGVDRLKTYLNAVRADPAARQVPALSHRPPGPPFLEGQDMTQPGSHKDARTLLNQANAVESVAKALRAWADLLKGMVVPPGGSEEARRPTRELFTLIVRHARLLRRLLNEFGCHEYIRPKITSMLDVASSAERGEDVGGYWCRARDYASEDLCGGPCSVPDELAKWVQRLRAEAVNCPEPEDLAKGEATAGHAAKGAVGTGAATVIIWQDVQRQLLELVEKGERFTSFDKLAAPLRCAKNTVRKAVKNSDRLRAWKDAGATKSPRAQSLNTVVMDNARSKEPDPADVPLADEVDRTMRRLIEQAETPEKRAALNALDEDQRRELVRLALEQAGERRVEEEAPRGNRILGRKP